MPPLILVVEDEPSIADNIMYALTTEGFEPRHCATGRAALDALASCSPALVIVDVGLPDVNGFELAKEILRRSPLPLIFVTARADEVDRIVGLEIGADDYVVKPFSPRELTARVKAVLRRTKPEAAPNSASAGPFKVDQERCKIYYHGTTLDLSRYEYRLLAVLIGRPGRVFTREELMSRVSEEPGMSLERTVDTHIKTIRRKLAAVRAGEDPIVTHRGIGYSLREEP